MPGKPGKEPEAVMSSTACSRVMLPIPVRALFLIKTNGTTPRTDRSKDVGLIGGVAEPGNTSESARSGTLFVFTPGASAVETGVEFFTASMPEPDPEKLSRILTGVAWSDDTLLDKVPLKVIRPVAA